MNYYFHVPFCRSKCGYCSFYSEAKPSAHMVKRYLDKLESDLARYAVAEPTETINLGGGTPTLLTIDQLGRLFTMILRKLKPAPGTEISIEANPETLDAEKVALIRAFANRISLGVQSFKPKLRETLGRDCSEEALERATGLIADARFPHWNCDLIYAIPGQRLKDFEIDLDRALALGVDHLSCYNLTREEGARLSDKLIPSEKTADAMWRLAGERTAAAGFRRYEISNYAKKGGECRHNLNVWRGGVLQGFGPAAAGYDGKKRFMEPESLRQWLKGASMEFDEIPLPDRLNEIFMINLRTGDGWTPTLWKQVPGADRWAQRLEIARKTAAKTREDFFDIQPRRIRLSDHGLLFWNTVAENII